MVILYVEEVTESLRLSDRELEGLTSMTRTLNLPLPLMNQATMGGFATTGGKPECSGVASAQNYGKLSVRV